jgi:hypothetical protein
MVAGWKIIGIRTLTVFLELALKLSVVALFEDFDRNGVRHPSLVWTGARASAAFSGQPED